MYRSTLALSLFVLLSGCASSNDAAKSINNSKYIEYNNTEHIIGTKNNKIDTLIYIEKKDNKILKKLTFYIDKYPYKKTFNLCSDRKSFQNISGYINNKNKTPIYKQDSVDCISSISIYNKTSKFNNFNFNFLLGFNKGKIGNFYHLSSVKSHKQSNITETDFIPQTYNNITTYWTFK